MWGAREALGAFGCPKLLWEAVEGYGGLQKATRSYWGPPVVAWGWEGLPGAEVDQGGCWGPLETARGHKGLQGATRSFEGTKRCGGPWVAVRGRVASEFYDISRFYWYAENNDCMWRILQKSLSILQCKEALMLQKAFFPLPTLAKQHRYLMSHQFFWTKLRKINELRKKFEKTKRISLFLAFYLKPLRIGSQLKSVCQRYPPFHMLISTGPNFKAD
jgi:hypothetical protein